MKILAVSDIHSKRFKTPPDAAGSDYLFVAGDLCVGKGTLVEAIEALTIIAKQANELNIPKVLITLGNHDRAFGETESLPVINEVVKTIELAFQIKMRILIDETVVLEDGLKVFFSPYHQRDVDGDWTAFHYDQEMTDNLFSKKIPLDTDILVTHGPPYSILDWKNEAFFGCKDYLAFLRNGKHKIKTCIFGHVHNCGSMKDTVDGIECYNVATSSKREHQVARVIHF